MRVSAASATNEDRAHCGTTMFVVADGLGGHAAGEVAAGMAIGPLEMLDNNPFDNAATAAKAMAEAVREANRLVFHQAAADRALAGMGTTLTAASPVGDQLALAHVGDSRAYLARPGDPLRRLTRDHTVVEEAVQAGLLSEASAARHPQRNVLTRAVGLDPEVEVDTPDPVPLRAGDRVLLCSDGLHDAVSEAGIGALLRSPHADPAGLCRALVGAALANGGPDNVTVVVLELHPDGGG
jgi:serine/threonine protein phosphatase PrpC